MLNTKRKYGMIKLDAYSGGKFLSSVLMFL